MPAIFVKITKKGKVSMNSVVVTSSTNMTLEGGVIKILRGYELLSTDVDKLPTSDDLMTGSSAYCIDTSDYYKYEATTKQWYKQ